MLKKIAIALPLLLIPIASVAFLVHQGFIKADFLKNKEVPGPPPVVESFKIDSKENGKSYDVTVELPAKYKDSKDSYPVIYAVDDRPHLFDYAKVLDPLIRASKIKDVIVVGVSPARRGRRPSSASWLEDTTRTQQQFGKQAPQGGKSAAFLAFLEKELMPKIEADYRAARGERCLAGHDFGGVLVVETALSRPELFDRYLAIAPLAEFANSAPIKLAEERLKAGFDPPARMYLVMGADDYRAHMASFLKLVETMKSKRYEKFVFESAVLPNQDHARIVVPGAQQGLEALFKKS